MLKKWFKDSEVLFWARLQVVLGIVATAITFVEPSVLQPILPPDWFPLLVIANGFATEILRRLRAEDMN